MKLEDLTVESIAQMTKEQKETFVSTFVKKYFILQMIFQMQSILNCKLNRWQRLINENVC